MGARAIHSTRLAGRASLQLSPGATRCRRKFLRFFPEGFRDDTYRDFERGYKWRAHQEWEALLGRAEFTRLLREGDFATIAARAVKVEGRTHLLFSFEKMALRDAVRSKDGARAFAEGLFELLWGDRSPDQRFETWCSVVAGLPRRQTRVLTWPIVTVFGFIATPKTHIYYKPMVTKKAAQVYEFELQYQSRPSWRGYENLLAFAEVVRRDLRDLRPRDMIDVQSFLWVQGSSEYD
jgi:hypothetical protein